MPSLRHLPLVFPGGIPSACQGRPACAGWASSPLGAEPPPSPPGVPLWSLCRVLGSLLLLWPSGLLQALGVSTQPWAPAGYT